MMGQVTLAGVGLHTGQVTAVTLEPAPPGTGRVFYRENRPMLAHVHAVQPSALCTTLAQGMDKIHTVEHLLAALVGLGIDDVAIHVTGDEIPLLDGSAQPWVEQLQSWGTGQPTVRGMIREPVVVVEGDRFVAALPSEQLLFTCGIDFPDYPAIGRQWVTWVPAQEPFATAIAPARTFGLADQVAHWRAQGLIRGGSLANALVCDRKRGWLNPPLRFPDEPARHKLLDFLGDLALLGTLPRGHYLAYKAGHRLHLQLAAKLWTTGQTPSTMERCGSLSATP
ncbi:MAG: UDP-3-O-acyl-N-acetylglucosamine deacetylase [Gloeomargarita sp. SKYBB_i_bin120]|nr:UDP-3-O-acyl-N-acetylglucosamine deacetylase [Gloeomargarita sp. SKYG98]MCS7292214.1 UDP-3-O-acyl-N-acetylglucosamine deacetylase [Gloeomargarita sp. SKYB120]MDW8177775.1 UDP-3-O-acyl-N-acetylglucosamine deacetylase [Gloeomargarita sp. SKYBB_i_bin120]